jgi:acyl-ACP thioesterase
MTGRRFHGSRRVRLSDTASDGRLRLDAIGRYLQDVASDDAEDAGLGEETWVMRRLDLDVRTLPRLADHVALTTWCTGTGPRWAERTTTLRGEGGEVDARAMWIHVDPNTGAPAPLPPRFAEQYAEAAQGRKVSVRLAHGSPPAALVPRPWTVRTTDLDILGHVNNAVYWVVLEELLQRSGRTPEHHHLELEFRGGLVDEPASVVVAGDVDGDLDLWVLGEHGDVAATMQMRPA